MFYDLNVPWTPNDNNLPQTLAFLRELGYNVVALNHTFSGKLPKDLTSPIPQTATTSTPNLTVLRRVTLVLTDSYPNARLAALGKAYDLLALRPIDERTLQQACSTLQCDIISLDLTQRYPFYFRHKTLAEAVRGGKRLELCYAQGLVHADPQARRNVIANATQLIRACRGRGMVISSETSVGAVGCRGPWDVINLAAVWGLGSERGVEAVGKEARWVVVGARLKRTSYRGSVNFIYTGESLDGEDEGKEEQAAGQGGQTGAVANAEASSSVKPTDVAPISKREAKRRAKQARMAAVVAAANATSASDGQEAATSTPVEPLDDGSKGIGKQAVTQKRDLDATENADGSPTMSKREGKRPVKQVRITEHGSGKEAAIKSGKETAGENGKEAVVESGKEAAGERGKEAASESGKEATDERANDAAATSPPTKPLSQGSSGEKEQSVAQKRKADAIEDAEDSLGGKPAEQPLSKREGKRPVKQARFADDEGEKEAVDEKGKEAADEKEKEVAKTVPAEPLTRGKGKQAAGQNRQTNAFESTKASPSGKPVDAPISKRQSKRQRKQAR